MAACSCSGLQGFTSPCPGSFLSSLRAASPAGLLGICACLWYLKMALEAVAVRTRGIVDKNIDSRWQGSSVGGVLPGGFLGSHHVAGHAAASPSASSTRPELEGWAVGARFCAPVPRPLSVA